MTAEILPTGGHPVVLGEWRGAGASAPTVLVYGHYDVQPAEPLELWTSPPFEPVIRDGRIYARGSVDDKGQLFLHIKAIQAHLATREEAPGEHDRARRGRGGGGEREPRALHRAEREAARVRLRGDLRLARCSRRGCRASSSSLRGLAYFQIDVQGPAGDLHSGSYGGAVVNPAMVLARIIATLPRRERPRRDPGLLRQGARLVAAPRARRSRSCRSTRRPSARRRPRRRAVGEKGYTTLERVWTRPTCEVNGLLSGYTGEGAKTVLPAKAMAKVSCRLVPDQSPPEIEQLMKAHVEKRHAEGRDGHGGAPARRPPLARRARAARSSTPRAARSKTAFAKRAGDRRRRRLDPRRRRFPASPRRPGAARRLRPPRRERARAERVDERREFREGDAGDGGVVGRADTAVEVEDSGVRVQGPGVSGWTEAWQRSPLPPLTLHSLNP